MGEEVMDLTTLIINFNTANLLPKCIADLRDASVDISSEIIIVDNASKDDSTALLKREYSDFKLIFNDTNVGFGRANNQCVPFIQGRYVLLLNTDAFVSKDTINKTIQYMDEHSECGVLGVKLLGREGDLQPSCRYFPTPFALFIKSTGLQRFFKGVQATDDMEWAHDEPRECDWVPGCYYLIRREVMDAVGLFDPRYFLYYEEVDHCFATKKAGWQVHCYPGTSVVHIGGESAKLEGTLTSSGRQLDVLKIESELLYFRKNHSHIFVLFHLVLLTLADMINLAKKTIKLNNKSILWGYFKHSYLVWSLYFKTRLATTRTR